jgi:hypothetical protein
LTLTSSSTRSEPQAEPPIPRLVLAEQFTSTG